MNKFDESTPTNEETIVEPDDDLYTGIPRFRKPLNLRGKRNVRITSVLLLALLLIIGVVGIIIGLTDRSTPFDDSLAFYFTSDLLSEDGGEFIAYDTIEFNVRNYADSLRVSREAIENFEITITCNGKDITKKAEISLGVTDMEPNVRSGCAVSITLPNKYINQPVEVSVTSYPIEKTISGVFTLKPGWGYEVNDSKGSICSELVIYANKSVSVKVTWDEDKLIPDSTEEYIRAEGLGNNYCRIDLEAGSVITVPLFKADTSKDYSDNSKVITVEKYDGNEDDKKTDSKDTAKETEKSEAEDE